MKAEIKVEVADFFRSQAEETAEFIEADRAFGYGYVPPHAHDEMYRYIEKCEAITEFLETGHCTTFEELMEELANPDVHDNPWAVEMPF